MSDDLVVKFQVPKTRGTGSHHPVMWGQSITIQIPKDVIEIIKKYIPEIAETIKTDIIGKKVKLKTIELCLVLNTFSWDDKKTK